MASENSKKYILFGSITLVVILVGVSIYQYNQQAKTRESVREQARQIQGLQGKDTVTAKDLLEKMSDSMNKNHKVTFEI